MPHLIVEYSSNLQSRVDRQALVQEVHRAGLETGVFPIGGIRVRLHEIAHYAIADNHPDNGFIHIQMRIGEGRDAQTRRRAAQAVFDHLAEYLEPVFQASPFGLSVELCEIDGETSFKKNNMHEYVARRQAATGQSDEQGGQDV